MAAADDLPEGGTATERDRRPPTRTESQQLNLQATEKLVGACEPKVWFQSIILAIHYVLCKRL